MADVDIRIQARDESRAAFASARENAKGLVGTLATLGPALAPVLAAAATAAVGLASTLGGAAVSAGAFKLAVQPQMAAIQDVTAAQDKYNEAVRQYGKDSDQAKAAMKEYQSQMDQLPAATQATAKEFSGLKSDFSAWSDSLAGSTMPVFTKGIQILRTILPTLTPIVKGAAAVFGDLMTKLQKKVEGKGFQEFMKKVADWANSGLKKVVSGVLAIGSAVGGFVMGDGFREFLAMGQQAGGNLGDILKKLAQFAIEFVKAAGPLAGLSFQALAVLADALNAIPQSVLEILAPMIMAIVVAMKAWHLANVIFTAGQLALNTVMMAAPWVLITLAIIAVVVAIVALWKKNEGFRNFIKDAWEKIKQWTMTAFEFLKNLFLNWTGPGLIIKHWDRIKTAISDAWTKIKGWVRTALDFVKNLFLNWTGPGLIIKHWNAIKDGARTGVNKIKELWNGFIDFFRGIPGRISSAARGMWNSIGSGFKSAVNGIIRAWNNLSFSIGGGSFMGVDIPKFSLNTPNIPYLARGGIASGLAMVGERGRELVDLPTGSRVRSNPDTERLLNRNSGGGQPMQLIVQIGGKLVGKAMINPLRNEIRSMGGDVQFVLGSN